MAMVVNTASDLSGFIRVWSGWALSIATEIILPLVLYTFKMPSILLTAMDFKDCMVTSYDRLTIKLR